MTSEPNSSSFMPTEESKRREAIILLGKRIVEEFENVGHTDTATKWMAHVLAEQMQAVDEETDPKSRAILQTECCALIMKIWKRRASLPQNARPAGRLTEAIDAILAIQKEAKGGLSSWLRDAGRLTSPWFAFAVETCPDERAMSIIAYLTGVLESQIGSENRWVSENNEMLSDDERKLIKALNSWLETAESFLRRGAGDKSKLLSAEPSERNSRIIEALEARMKRQNEALAKLRARVLNLPLDGEDEAESPSEET